MGDEVQEQQIAAEEQLKQLSLNDATNEADNVTEQEQQAASDQLPDLTNNDVNQPKQLDTKEQNEEQPAALAQLDPALKQALLDSNRETVLNIEATVQQFLADSSQSSLPFPPSLSNYQRLLEHKVSQHHQLETTTAFENGQPRVLAKRPSNGNLTPQQKLADIDINTIKIAPKALIKRPPAGQHQHRDPNTHLHHHHQHHNSNPAQQNNLLQRPKSHQEREADYHEARARIIGSSSVLPHSGSAGNLAEGSTAASNLAGNGSTVAGNRPASAGASMGGAALGTGYLAAVPPIAGERGFNIVNPGRGMGRGNGSSTVPAAAAAAAAPAAGANPQPAAPGRGAGSRSAGAVHPEPSAFAAASGNGGSSASQRASAGAQQQQQRRQQQQQQQPGGGPKAIYRDKQRDVQDPDYARGVDRYQQRFDPGFGGAVPQAGMYMMPSYGSEFPSLAGAYGGQQQQHNRPTQQQRQWQQQNGSAAAATNGSYHGQHKQQHNGSQRHPGSGSSGQQQQQQQPGHGPAYNQGYGAQGYPYSAGFPMADMAGMFNQGPPGAAAAGYGGYAAGGFPADYVAYGGYQYGYPGYGAVPAGYDMGYAGYGGYPAAAAAGQWQGAGQQQQQYGGRGGHGRNHKGGNSGSNS